MKKKKWLIVFLLVLIGIGIGLFLFPRGKVHIYHMDTHGEVITKKGVHVTDPLNVLKIKFAVFTAVKQPGIRDMIAPMYTIDINGKTYALWLYSKGVGGVIMHEESTTTAYKLNTLSAKYLYSLIREQVVIFPTDSYDTNQLKDGFAISDFEVNKQINRCIQSADFRRLLIDFNAPKYVIKSKGELYYWFGGSTIQNMKTDSAKLSSTCRDIINRSIEANRQKND